MEHESGEGFELMPEEEFEWVAVTRKEMQSKRKRGRNKKNTRTKKTKDI